MPRAVTVVRPEEHNIELDDGSTLEYDNLIMCVGGRLRDAAEGAVTLEPPEVD
jgi:NADH dehydrogenase FAD-containing subunit